MYKVLCDNVLICDSRVEELALIDPEVTLEENKAGSFSFKITPNHPFYDSIHRKKSIIEVYKNDEMIFCGMCVKSTDDFYRQRSITCEGELSFLNDSIQRPARYQNITVRGLLESLIENHNLQVEDTKHFEVGQITVTDPNDSIYCYTNMESTMQCLKDDLIDDLGGFFRIRHENGTRYIDYLKDSPNTNSQIIKFGENLLDFASNIDSSQIATAIIPLGEKLEESAVQGLETRLTIESVNNGLDYVHSEEAVETYGWIYKKVVFDNVTTPERLKSKGLKYLHETQFENMVIHAKAIDLNLTDSDIERFKIHDSIRVVSSPHGLDKYFRLTKQKLKLNNQENDEITLGKNEQVSLSAKSVQASEAIKKAIESIVPQSNILNQAVKNATALINSAMGGYVYKTNNELYIMDTDDPETAKKVWRWNINGLGYSSTGIKGEYGLAMTMDGSIVASAINTGILRVGNSFYANCDTGKVTLSADTINSYEKLTTLYAENYDSVRVWYNKDLIAEGEACVLQDAVSFKIGAFIDGKKVSLDEITGITISETNVEGTWDAKNRTYTVQKVYRKDTEEKFVRFSMNINNVEYELTCYIWLMNGLTDSSVITYEIETENAPEKIVWNTESKSYDDRNIMFKLKQINNGSVTYPNIQWRICGEKNSGEKVVLKTGTSNISSFNPKDIDAAYEDFVIEYSTNFSNYNFARATKRIPIIKQFITNTQEGIFDALTNGGQAQGLYIEDGQLYLLFNYAKGGTLSLGGVNDENGKLVVNDENGEKLGEWNNGGIVLTKKGYITAYDYSGQKVMIGNGCIECYSHPYNDDESVVLTCEITNNGVQVISNNNKNLNCNYGCNAISMTYADGKQSVSFSHGYSKIGNNLYILTSDGNYYEGGEVEWVFDSTIGRYVLGAKSLSKSLR